MTTVTLYGNNTCPYCGAARMLLVKKGVAVDDISVNQDPEKQVEMQARSGRSTVPQIFLGDRHIGGFDELCALDESGELDELLADEKLAGP